MDGMLGERMKQLLADPDAMSQVMEMAGRLFGSGEGQEDAGQSVPEAEPQVRSESREAPEREGRETRGSEADRMRLIDAICPFLSPGRREAAQSMLRVLRLLSLAEQSGILGSLGRGGSGREEG